MPLLKNIVSVNKTQSQGSSPENQQGRPQPKPPGKVKEYRGLDLVALQAEFEYIRANVHYDFHLACVSRLAKALNLHVADVRESFREYRSTRHTQIVAAMRQARNGGAQ